MRRLTSNQSIRVISRTHWRESMKNSAMNCNTWVYFHRRHGLKYYSSCNHKGASRSIASSEAILPPMRETQNIRDLIPTGQEDPGGHGSPLQYFCEKSMDESLGDLDMKFVKSTQLATLHEYTPAAIRKYYNRGMIKRMTLEGSGDQRLCRENEEFLTNCMISRDESLDLKRFPEKSWV